jgi:hypothetical protein
MLDIDLDLNEHIESVLDRQLLDGHKTAVAVVYNKVTFKGLRCQIVYAASSVRNVPKD